MCATPGSIPQARPDRWQVGLVGYEINFNRYSDATSRRSRWRRSRPTSSPSKPTS